VVDTARRYQSVTGHTGAITVGLEHEALLAIGRDK
jgi:hypothetical protein